MILIGNWKMHGCNQEIETFLRQLEPLPETLLGILCLPFVYLHKKNLLPQGYAWGAQDCSVFLQGPYTAQISVLMLKECGCTHVIVGHPERKEEDDIVRQKALRVLDAGLVPIVCAQSVASLEQRILSQECWIAYEPAVGASALPDNLTLQLEQIRSQFPGNRVLYGGGVDAHNIVSLKYLFDGLLTGRASLDIHQWQSMIKILAS